MSITAICECGKSIQVPDEFAGKTGKCKACGAKLLIPFLSHSGRPTPVPQPPPPPMNSAFHSPSEFININTGEDEWEPLSGTTPAIRDNRASAPVGPLGWYYPTIRVLAYVVMGVGFVPLLIFVIHAVMENPDASYRPTTLSTLTSLSILSLWIVVGFVVGCSLLLLTDIARAVRVQAARR